MILRRLFQFGAGINITLCVAIAFGLLVWFAGQFLSLGERTPFASVLSRLITIAMPRVRDFRGVSGKSFDGRGNYAMGLKEHIVFPEIDYDKVDQIWGMDVIVCTTAKTDEEARALLTAFNFPFPQ